MQKNFHLHTQRSLFRHKLPLQKLIEKYTKKKAEWDKEIARFQGMCRYEEDAYHHGYQFIAGIDEAGRGPLAGPVVAAAVILPEGIFIEGLNDSKQLSPKKRDLLFDIIKEKAISYGVGIVDRECIDEINILNATRKAMKIAIDQLSPQPDLLLVDAEKIQGTDIRQVNIVKGDTLSISIAAASILAKVTRDRMIDEMDMLYPQYGFSKHKGYGTKDHINAIKKFGLCPIHRISFTKNFAKS
ncbi:MAG: ribonuclease HII [Candidatus Bathyarchaeota archaeon]|nr:ribonuclease HII [Candidatus Bathyarchaeota archaeon]